MAKSSRLKWVSALVVIGAAAALLLLVGIPKWADMHPVTVYNKIKREIAKRKMREPINISQIVVNPKNPDILYASSHFYAMLKSIDHGKSWKFSYKGFGTSDVYTVVMHPEKPDTLFAATVGGGIYRTEDGAATWTDVNTGITDTHIQDIAFDPGDPMIVYAASLREVFKSTDGGTTWHRAFDKNRFVFPSTFGRILLVARFPKSPKPVLFIGTSTGGARRAEGDGQWEDLAKKVGDQKLTSFAYDARRQRLYAGSMMGQFFESMDGGKKWGLVGTLPAGKMWIHRITLHPADPNTIFAASRGHGIFKSTDAGRTWTETDEGVTHKMIKAVAIDPVNPQYMFTGAPGMLATSSDGGARWQTVKVDLIHYKDVVKGLSFIKRATDRTPPPPEAMKQRCNWECHGWTDPLLNYRPTAYWRVSPTPREWSETMIRMSARAKLTPEEEAIILGYLNNYFGPK